ncbi:MAG: (2Fe-2S)-binding protein [Gemmobacter sp.]
MIRLTLNGAPVALDAAPDRTLAAILREDLGLTGTKLGCSIGRCGACTVLLDGAAVNACLVMAWQAEGRAVTTVEGLGALAAAPAVTAALAAENAFQCGYCAPGITLALTALLTETPDADDAAIATALEGHICRCTGYHSILGGAARAAAACRGEAP